MVKEAKMSTKKVKLLLVYPPFCTPTIMPYSISYLKSFVKNNSSIDVKCIDLNAKFHRQKFQEYYIKLKTTKNLDDYAGVLGSFHKESSKLYSENNKLVLNNKEPELIDEMVDYIQKENPTHVAFSLVYNSQNFYTKALIKKLGIPILTGGPAVSPILKKESTFIADEIKLLEHFHKKSTVFQTSPDFSDYKKTDYLTKHTIIPIKSSTSCYYKQCAFCTHHKNLSYFELPLENISKNKYLFFIDDMISTKRLLEIAQILKPHNVKWWVQLRPTKNLIPHLKELADSGLKSIAWGVESGSQKILDLMEKGTKVNDIRQVLQASKEAGIINIAFIMFGFPTETKVQFIETIEFLKSNSNYIDLVSTSIFGLQKDSKVYNNPSLYKIGSVQEKKRTILDSKISFKVSEGLREEEIKLLKKQYSSTIIMINKLPKIFNYMKEQTLFC